MTKNKPKWWQFDAGQFSRLTDPDVVWSYNNDDDSADAKTRSEKLREAFQALELDEDGCPHPKDILKLYISYCIADPVEYAVNSFLRGGLINTCTDSDVITGTAPTTEDLAINLNSFGESVLRKSIGVMYPHAMRGAAGMTARDVDFMKDNIKNKGLNISINLNGGDDDKN